MWSQWKCARPLFFLPCDGARHLVYLRDFHVLLKESTRTRRWILRERTTEQIAEGGSTPWTIKFDRKECSERKITTPHQWSLPGNYVSQLLVLYSRISFVQAVRIGTLKTHSTDIFSSFNLSLKTERYYLYTLCIESNHTRLLLALGSISKLSCTWLTCRRKYQVTEIRW